MYRKKWMAIGLFLILIVAGCGKPASGTPGSTESVHDELSSEGTDGTESSESDTVEENSSEDTTDESISDAEIEPEDELQHNISLYREEANRYGIAYSMVYEDYYCEGEVPLYYGTVVFPLVFIEGDIATSEIINNFFGDIIESQRANVEYNCKSAREDYEYAQKEGFYFNAYENDLYIYMERADDKLISFQCSNYDYYGGAHGDYYRYGYTFDKKTGELLNLLDMSDDREEMHRAVKEAVLEQAAAMETENPGMFFYETTEESMGSSIDMLIESDQWIAGNDGISILSNPYFMTPYSEGVITFKVGYDEVGVREEYRPMEAEVLPIRYGCGKYADLDGDGEEEYIYAEKKFEDYSNRIELYVGGILYTAEDSDLDFGYDYLTDYFYVCDLDTTDGTMEIAVCDEGPSNDPITYFFRLEDGKMRCIGSVPALISGSYLYGDGTIAANFRISLLETNWAAGTYRYTPSADEVLLVSQDWYELQNRSDGHAILTDFMVYTSDDLMARKEQLSESDGPVSFLRTDDEHWVVLRTAAGSEYYMYMQDFSTIVSGDTELSATDVFDGLNMAD